jgi:Protein of unknown function (DUF3616)
MSSATGRAATILLIFAVAGCLSSAAAQDDKTWPVKHRLFGKAGEKSEDVSGIACTSTHGFPRSCLVIDDNLPAAQAVTVMDGEIIAGEPVPLIDNAYRGKPLDLDGEGVAYADGYYYVIGSHGRPRHAKKTLTPKDRAQTEAASQIVRFSVGPGGERGPVERTARLKEIIASDAVLGPFMERPLDDNGLTIEGVAVIGGRLFAGFRGPALDHGRAAVLSVPLGALFGAERTRHELYRLPLGKGRGVRDLAAYGNGILVLAGPTAKKPDTYAVYWWDGAGENVRLLRDLADVVGKKGKRKPEALLPLDESPSGLRVLVLFDGEPEGGPVAVTMPKPAP